MFICMATTWPRLVSPVHKLFPNSSLACRAVRLSDLFITVATGLPFPSPGIADSEVPPCRPSCKSTRAVPRRVEMI